MADDVGSEPDESLTAVVEEAAAFLRMLMADVAGLRGVPIRIACYQFMVLENRTGPEKEPAQGWSSAAFLTFRK